MRIAPADLVVEIGAGGGALTAPLAEAARRVIAVELDPDLARLLEEQRPDANVEVVQGDFTHFMAPRGAFRIVGNIPYARTAEMVRHVLDLGPVDAHLVVQREAAERFAGAPYAAETVASLRLKPWWHAEIVRRLRATDFEPPPAVESVVLWLARRSPPLVAQEERTAYLAFLERHTGRNRTLRGALGRSLTPAQIARLGADLRLTLDGPPLSASFEQWLGLYRFASLPRAVPVTRARRSKRADDRR